MSRNVGALTLLDISGPAWPVMGVLYLYLLVLSSTVLGGSSSHVVVKSLTNNPPSNTKLYMLYVIYMLHIQVHVSACIAAIIKQHTQIKKVKV
jgi:hypothetical protein